MFPQIVSTKFRFLETDYGYRKRLEADRCVEYQKADSIIRFSYSDYDEISLRVGQVSRGIENGFSAGVLIALTDPKLGFSSRDRFASTAEQIENALSEFDVVLHTHGRRILDGDPTVYAEMEALVEVHRVAENTRATRHRAEEALAAKDYKSALREYRSLGDRRSGLDTKRMEMCERQLGER
jgi:hypothetical protein